MNFSIDITKLNDEMARQPQWFFEALCAQSDAEMARDAAKFELDTLCAEVENDIRTNATSRMTDSAVAAAVAKDSRVVLATKRLLELRANANRARAACDALAQRATLLCGLSARIGQPALNRVRMHP